MRELAVRHFADTCDEATKKLLTQSGASPALINALSGGTYAIPPQEIARAQQDLAADTNDAPLQRRIRGNSTPFINTSSRKSEQPRRHHKA